MARDVLYLKWSMPILLLAAILLYRDSIVASLYSSESINNAAGVTTAKGDGGDNEDKVYTYDNGDHAAASFEFPLPDSEWIDDIEPNITGMCGAFKCVFESKTNKGRDIDRYGYLLAQVYDSEKGFDTIQRGWEKAQLLSSKYDIRHLFLAGPQERTISQQLADELSRNSQNSYFKEPKLIIQPVRMVPPRSYMFGCYESKRQNAGKKLAEYLLELNSNSNSSTALTTTSGVDERERYQQQQQQQARLQRFEDTIRCDLNTTSTALLSTEGNCMVADFQVFIDPQSGKIYHLDFDRCFERKAANPDLWDEKNGCRNNLLGHVEYLIEERKKVIWNLNPSPSSIRSSSKFDAVESAAATAASSKVVNSNIQNAIERCRENIDSIKREILLAAEKEEQSNSSNGTTTNVGDENGDGSGSTFPSHWVQLMQHAVN